MDYILPIILVIMVLSIFVYLSDIAKNKYNIDFIYYAKNILIFLFKCIVWPFKMIFYIYEFFSDDEDEEDDNEPSSNMKLPEIGYVKQSGIWLKSYDINNKEIGIRNLPTGWNLKNYNSSTVVIYNGSFTIILNSKLKEIGRGRI